MARHRRRSGIDQRACNDIEPGTVVRIPQDRIESVMLGEADDTVFSVDGSAARVEYLSVPSTTRPGIEIPVRFSLPAEGSGPFPAVVLNPGHSGTRDFHTLVANALAAAGIATVAMDFPGNGDSSEGWAVQCMTTMVADSKDCCHWFMERDDVDEERMGYFGHSMGGRIGCTVLGSGTSPYRTALLVAPYAGEGMYLAPAFTGLMDHETLEGAYEYALASGTWPTYGIPLGWEYSPEWFEDLQRDPSRGLARYTGSLCVLFGGADSIVSPAVARRVLGSATNASKVRGVFIDVGPHEMGLLEGTPANVASAAIDRIVDWFVGEL